jgi:hypothetical protein
VYWLSLAAIPRSILHRLRKILFNFLWKGNADASHLHLANWDSLARPKRFGGWGLLNIYNFSSALAASTLWRVLTTEGLWQKVLKEKYLHSTTVDTWLRSDTFTQPTASKMWKGLLKSIHLINNWLSWKPGSGSLVEIGRDRVLDLGLRSLLSPNLLTILHQKQILVLAQAWKRQPHVQSQDHWLDSAELGILGDLATEWEHYRRALHSLGISLNDSADELLWIGGDRSGILNSKNIYLAICDTQNFPIATGWRKNFWNWDLQLKVKLFLWLAANDKILTWSNLQRRGWEGPNRCYLCNYDCETTDTFSFIVPSRNRCGT